MFQFTSIKIRSLLVLITSLVIFPVAAESSLTADLQSLVVDARSINTQLSALTLNTANGCSELSNAIHSVEDITKEIDEVSEHLTEPETLDVDALNALDDLSIISVSIASVLPVLSADISTMEASSDQADIQAALSAMLRLSNDIGVMADRILEMADKILIMANNIGEMADRILLTQQIQSSNMALTQAFILSTQENMIALNVTVDTSIYNNPLSDLITTGDTLSTDMNNTQLSESNMDSELADFENRINSYLAGVVSLLTIVNSDSSIASHYINDDTLIMLGDLSTVNLALANSLNRYAEEIRSVAADTDNAVLNDSVYSVLRLSRDIGVMAGRIIEMGNKIYVMADNIGLMSVRIVETQDLQQSNLNLTQSNLSTAQITTVSVISEFGL